MEGLNKFMNMVSLNYIYQISHNVNIRWLTASESIGIA